METNNSYFYKAKAFLLDRFNLSNDTTSQSDIAKEIEKGVVFRGTNLWILIFAMIIASVGLNVNSTAVIIGAMLISPLMGPITGIGYSLGVQDITLLKKAFRNFVLAVSISIVASTIYFYISPITDPGTELIARTYPTIWDVSIAFFGGLAGIVVQSRKEVGRTVIPGVAIATALMPPLCTVGYGLANMKPDFIFGALYLFTINAIFITLATYVVVTFLKFEKKDLLNDIKQKRVKRLIFAVAFITLVPSIYLAYNMVKEVMFDKNVDTFITSTLKFEETRVVSTNKSFKNQTVELVTAGKAISEDAIVNIRMQLPQYGLEGVRFSVLQSNDAEVGVLDSKSFTDFYVKTATTMEAKDSVIKMLTSKINNLEMDMIPAKEVAMEMFALNSNIDEIAVYKTSTVTQKEGEHICTFCIIKSKNPESIRTEAMKEWLKVRTKSEDVEFVIIKPKADYKQKVELEDKSSQVETTKDEITIDNNGR